MESKDRHKLVRCKVCSKSMRSDHVKRHVRTHKDILSMTDDGVREELRARSATEKNREQRRQEIKMIAQQEGISIDQCKDIAQPITVDASTLEEELLHNNQEYQNMIEMGEKIAVIIDKGVVCEESLIRDHKAALDLYRKQKPRIDIAMVQLRPWQYLLKKIVSKPSDREVIWICGFNGNEGKSWFQSYLETFYGYARVARLDLRNKTSNILHTLSKRPLQTTDIFIFNDTRASDRMDQNYAVLEHIKDGCAVSSKYNSIILNFKTPNTLIVFSNSRPDTSSLSKDRWKIYSIDDDGLKDTKTGKMI